MNYELLMKEVLRIAELGRGIAHPNPLVGALIVDDNGEILAQGFHVRAGENHAEINVLENLAEKNISPAGKTMIVTLEPCNHHGKTPPCAEAIIKAGIKKVVIGASDTNPSVEGKGADRLRDAGIEVVEGILEYECRKQNRAFFSINERKTPWVVAKWAMSVDGKIATKTGDSYWITSDESREFARELRANAGAVLVGAGTVVTDDPMLNYRGYKDLKQPVRIVLDPNSRTQKIHKIYADDGTKILRVTTVSEESLGMKDYDVQISGFNGTCANVTEIVLPKKNVIEWKLDLKLVLKILSAEFGVSSVLVEGGAKTITAFHEAGLIDEVNVFISPKIIGGQDALSPIVGEGIESMKNLTRLVEPTYRVIANQDVYVQGFVNTELFMPTKKGKP